MMPNNRKRRILAIGAHGDDIELACGGSLAKFIEEGHTVKVVVVTGTGLTDRNNISIRTPKIATEEINSAAEILGINDVEILGYQDTEVQYSVNLIGDLDDIVASFNPDIVFTHFVFDTHQDHISTSQSTISACRNIKTVLLYEPINPSGQGYIAFRPNLYIDISKYIDQKIKSLKAHNSQLERYSEEWLRGVKSRAAFRGFELGTQYAECFEVLRMKFDF